MSHSRFSKYRRNAEFAPLRKLKESDSFVGKLTGEHEYQSADGPVPVLELVGKDGKPFGWMASGWCAIEELEEKDPQHGDWITVLRHSDQGRSHIYEITIIEPAKAGDE
jgi:hypothetical protein